MQQVTCPLGLHYLLIHQSQDEEEKQIEVDEALDQEVFRELEVSLVLEWAETDFSFQVTAAENEHLRNNKKEDCRMQ